MAGNELLGLCEDILVSFDPKKCTLDSHSEAFLQGKKNVKEHDKMFAAQVLYGCVRYKPALKVLLTSFYYTNSATTSRQDYTKYMILAYLALFRLEELGWSNFVRLVKSMPPEKMVVFLRFVHNREMLEKWVKDEWIKSYDLDFVNSSILGLVDKYASQVGALMAELSSVAFGGRASEERMDDALVSTSPLSSSKPPTVPVPFNITPARPTRVPEPLRIKQEVVAKPMPATLNRRTLADIEQERQKAKEEQLSKTADKYSSGLEFQLHETRDTLTRLVEERDRKLNKLQRHFVAKPAPTFEKPAVVNMNTSAVLREDYVYKQKQAAEAKLVESYEEDLRDSTEFVAWQQARREEDEVARLKRVEQRRMESAASQAEARLASERQLRLNKAEAVKLRISTQLGVAQLEKEKEEVFAQKSAVVESVKSTRDIPEQNRQRIISENAARAAQKKKEQRELALKCEEEKRVEQERRSDLIRRIRAIERVPAANVGGIFDPSASGGHGLLEEMSLMELAERLKRNEENERRRVEELHSKAIRQRQRRTKSLEERIAFIRRARTAAAQANHMTKQDAKKREEELHIARQEAIDDAKIKLASKLKAVREKRIAEIEDIHQQEQERQKRNMFLGAAKDQVEARMHEEWLKGLERTCVATQRAAQLDASKRNKIKVKEQQIKQDNKSREAKKTQEAKERNEVLLLQAMKKKKEKDFELIKEKRALVREEQGRYASALEQLRSINSYASSIASGVPIQVIQTMDKDRMTRFFESKPKDLSATYQFLCPDAPASATIDHKIDLIRSALKHVA